MLKKNISLAFIFAIIYIGNTQAGDTPPVRTFEGRIIIPFFVEPAGSPSSYMVRVAGTTASVLMATGNATGNTILVTRILVAQGITERYQDATERTKLLQNQKPASKKSRCRCSCTLL